MLSLSAAVSDFFIPDSELSEHKIQSRGSGGSIQFTMRAVPKLLGMLKRSERPWCQKATVVSFKLETNENILVAKAAAAIRDYGVDAVCANRLKTYKREVCIVTRDEGEEVVAPAVLGDETELVHASGVSRLELSLGALESGLGSGDSSPEIEDLIVDEFIRLHDRRIGGC